jgi:hypothetical protein
MSKLALEIGIYNKLIADSGAGGVAALATGGIYNTQAADDATLPLVLFNVSDDPIGQRFSATDLIDAEFTIEVIADKELGAVPMDAIVDRAVALLNNQTLTISGFEGNSVQCLNRGVTFTDVDAIRSVSVYKIHANA